MYSIQSSHEAAGINLGKLQSGLTSMLEARVFAEDAERDAWEFSVEMLHLNSLGLTCNSLRWLVSKGYAEHACEYEVPGQTGREFQASGELCFCKRTVFVLTDAGASFARRQLDRASNMHTGRVNGNGEVAVATPTIAHSSSPTTPTWGPQSRELRVGDVLVRRYKSSAVNQETVLAVFEEEGWPSRIDDPLPPQPGQCSKHRLHDTIKCLNRNQTQNLIRFRGDGTGEGVCWELVGKQNSD